MFDKNLYITKGIDEKLDKEIVCQLWTLLQNAKERELDYLQIFEFQNVGTEKAKVLQIKWSQEEPENVQYLFLPDKQTDIEKVWVICTAEGTDEEYSTMLLPEEY